VVDDPDAIWKPGYEGPTPTVESDTEPVDDSPPELPLARPARWRWWFGVGVVLVVALVAVVAVVALDPLGVGGELDDDVASDGPVVGGPGDRRLPQSATELWSVDIGDIAAGGDHRVEVIGRELVVAVIETGPGSDTTLVAFDALTSERRWMLPVAGRPDDVAVVGAVGDVLVVEQPGEASPNVIAIDIATGETRRPPDSVSNSGQVGVLGTTSTDSLIPVSGTNFVRTSPGSISGVVVDGDAERVVWSRADGAVVDQHPIDGGMLLQVATRGGAGMELVDGLTGETVENLAMVPGALQALVVAGDGIVVLRPAVLGTRLVATDFDGIERWSILGSEPVVVGDRIVARATSIDGQLRISAYGDSD
jgi:hypothetical protein